MKSAQRAKRSQKARSDRRDSYDVGYGRPPKQYQFKDGESGNPRGRPKGAKNQATLLHDILHRKITILDRGRKRSVPLIEAMLLKFVEGALKGDPKSAAFLLNRYGPAESEDTGARELGADDQDILDAFAQRIRDGLKDDEK